VDFKCAFLSCPGVGDSNRSLPQTASKRVSTRKLMPTPDRKPLSPAGRAGPGFCDCRAVPWHSARTLTDRLTWMMHSGL
jgi:hypothetical protein